MSTSAQPGAYTRAALSDVASERLRQDAKWGQQDHDPFCYLAVLMEEVGEASQAALNLRFRDDGDVTKAVGLSDAYRNELVQVAAVAVAMIECLDRDLWKWGDAVKTVTVGADPWDSATKDAHVCAPDCRHLPENLSDG